MSTTRILLADDHALVRAGLKRLLEQVEGLIIVGEAATGLELLTLVSSTRPNLVLLDIAMPGLTGLDLLPRIRREHPTVAVLMLSAHANEEYMHRAMDRGAAGYVTKDSSVAELETAIRTILAGNRHFGTRIQSRPAASEVQSGTRETDAQLESLTGRQREILQLIAESRSTKEIAFQLSLSTKTVEAHRAQIMDRLNIRDVAGLVRFAIRVGLITTDPR